MRGNPNFKPDSIFAQYLAMAVAAEQAAIRHFGQYGHDFGFFDKGAGSDGIFRDPTLKGRRKADLKCIRCGQLLEVRSKSKLKIAMSNSQTRRFDDAQGELSISDWVTFVQVHDGKHSNLRQPKWEICSPFYTVSVAALADTKALTIRFC